MTKLNLPLPEFYNEANASKWDYQPNQQELFEKASDWRKKHDIPYAGTDRFNLHLLLIDVQKDFCFPNGSLYVGGRSGEGALQDNNRTAQFIYRNMGVITDITTTLDTHLTQQIFNQSFWIDDSGNPLPPMTVITSEQIRKGEVQPNPAIARLCNNSYTWLRDQTQYYCDELEKAGKYSLLVWPYHCLLGSDGHALVGVIHEARLFQSFVRGSQSHVEVKGANPFTENYSVLRPEVLGRHDGKGSIAQKNTQFIEKLMKSDAIVIAGQAASHCVKSSIDDLLDEIAAKDPALAKKVYILEDCMSSVAVPDGNGGFIADFTEEAEKALDRFRNAGMNLVKSTDPIGSWGGVQI